MVPWPIALLSVFYGVIAATSAVSVWQVLTGVSSKPLVSQMAWLALAAVATLGLPLRSPWARWCGIAVAWWMAVSILAIAAWLIAARAPVWGLAAGFGTVVPLVAARYLTRPHVKQWFTPA